MWLHVNNCCKGAVPYLDNEGGTTGLTFCHQTGGPTTEWAYKREGLQPGFHGTITALGQCFTHTLL